MKPLFLSPLHPFFFLGHRRSGSRTVTQQWYQKTDRICWKLNSRRKHIFFSFSSLAPGYFSAGTSAAAFLARCVRTERSSVGKHLSHTWLKLALLAAVVIYEAERMRQFVPMRSIPRGSSNGCSDFNKFSVCCLQSLVLSFQFHYFVFYHRERLHFYLFSTVTYVSTFTI
jgi:hypothetical protein